MRWSNARNVLNWIPKTNQKFPWCPRVCPTCQYISTSSTTQFTSMRKEEEEKRTEKVYLEQNEKRHLPHRGNFVRSECFRVKSTNEGWPTSIAHFYHAKPYAVRQCMQSANRTMGVPECNRQVPILTVSYSYREMKWKGTKERKMSDTDSLGIFTYWLPV